MNRILVLGALLVTLITAALRFAHHPWERRGDQPSLVDNSAIAPVLGHESRSQPVIPQDSPDAPFESGLEALVAGFESEKEDPFLRERRAQAFQARIGLFSASEIATVYEIASRIVALNPGEAADDFRDRVFQRWRELDPTLAVIESPSANANPLATEIVTLGDADPIGAARRALNQLPEAAERTNVLIGLVQRFAAIDTASAAEWVERFPPGDLRERAREQLRRFQRPGVSVANDTSPAGMAQGRAD